MPPLQAHLVLESHLPFRLILYWKRLTVVFFSGNGYNSGRGARVTDGQTGIREDRDRLAIVSRKANALDVSNILEALREDMVVLIQDVAPKDSEAIVGDVALRLGLSDQLKLQAGFAGLLGHRERIGQSFMSVTKRRDYQFITPHSEGSSFAGMQLACFFCYENSTDGGETLLLNANTTGECWSFLRERLRRGQLEGQRVLPAHEIVRARGLYQLNLASDMLKEEDRILNREQSIIQGLTLLDVLAKPCTTYSKILGRHVHSYWATIGSADLSCAVEFERLLRDCGLLKEPLGSLPLERLDTYAHRRVWSSGITLASIFKCKITLKFGPGDLLIQNNLTWAHAVNNWSPKSGLRKVAASFA